MDYYVSEGRGVLTVDGTHLGSGQQVDPAAVSDVEALVRGGFVRLLDAPEPESEPVGRGRDVTPSKWTFDPADLAGKDLDELNVIVLDIDERVDPFDTVEEAVFWLCQDNPNFR